MSAQMQRVRGLAGRLPAFDVALAAVLIVVPLTDTWALRPGPEAVAVLSDQ